VLSRPRPDTFHLVVSFWTNFVGFFFWAKQQHFEKKCGFLAKECGFLLQVTLKFLIFCKFLIKKFKIKTLEFPLPKMV
jgi:hypothetical protein